MSILRALRCPSHWPPVSLPPTGLWRVPVRGSSRLSTRCQIQPLHDVERASFMDRVHSNLIIILLGGILLALGGILFVLLVGREEAISAIGGASVAGAFAVALVVGTACAVVHRLRTSQA